MAERAPGDPRCKDCPNEHEPGRVRCAACAENRRRQARLLAKSRRKARLCITCGQPVATVSGARRRYCKRHLEYYAARMRAA